MLKKQRLLTALAVVLTALSLLLTGCGKTDEFAADRPENPDFRKIFEDRGIDHRAPESDQPQAAGYVTVLEEGSLDVMELVGRDNEVTYIRSTVYFRVADMDEAGKADVLAYLEECADEIRGVAGISTEIIPGTDYHCYRVHMDHLDDMEVVKAVAEAGLLHLEEGTPDFIDFSGSAANIMAAGYISR